MGLHVTLGHGVGESVAAREVEVEVPAEEGLPLEAVAASLGVAIGDAEGNLLVFVNDALRSAAELSALRLRDGDRVKLYRMLAGG